MFSNIVWNDALKIYTLPNNYVWNPQLHMQID